MSDTESFVLIVLVGITFILLGTFLWGYNTGEKEAKKELLHKKPCSFCKGNTNTMAYRENQSNMRMVAEFCPVCGRSIPSEEDNK